MTPAFLKPLIFLVSIFVLTTAQGQIKRPHVLIGGNISYSVPKGSFAEGYRLGVGGELTGGIGSGKTFLLGTLGTSVFIADSKNPKGNLLYKPIKIGVRHLLLAKKLFIQGDLGMANVKDKAMSSSGNRFIRSIGAGARLLGLEGGIFYNGFKSISAAGFSNSLQVKIGWSKVL